LILNKDWELISLFPVDTVNFVSASSKDMVWNTLLRILSKTADLSAQLSFMQKAASGGCEPNLSNAAKRSNRNILPKPAIGPAQ